jgi:hypothetical protein
MGRNLLTVLWKRYWQRERDQFLNPGAVLQEEWIKRHLQMKVDARGKLIFYSSNKAAYRDRWSTSFAAAWMCELTWLLLHEIDGA